MVNTDWIEQKTFPVAAITSLSGKTCCAG